MNPAVAEYTGCDTRIISVDFRLYLITDRRLFPDPCDFFITLEKILEAGVTAIQLREKDLSQKDLYHMATRMRALTYKHRAKLFINDRVDVALSVRADGVQLGRESLPASAVKKISGDGFLIGISAHSIEEAVEAERDGADFITFGPVFETPSKRQFGRPIGIDTFWKVKRLTRIPVFGIGGIQPENVRQVREAGADGIALITGILAAKDVCEKTKEYLRLLQ
jgi:thiamine-phosphate pyrophosphorylase